ncbi:hypothetical protein FACS1894178_5040 [Bacteroidia bacterium]|nr:hypothetical protein FACS1894178_5040 [Bacteroidia bacterium]
MKRLTIILLLSSAFCFSHLGAQTNFNSLNLPISPQLAGLGVHFAAIPDGDFGIYGANHSLLSVKNDNDLFLDFSYYFNSYNHSIVGYAKNFKVAGTFAASLQYVSYGSIDEYDELGNALKKSYSYDMIFNIGWGKNIDSCWSIGANMKYLNSGLSGYHINALAFDVGASFVTKNRQLATSILLKNIGFNFNKTSIEGYSSLPIELLAAFSYKVNHAPFRFCVTLQNLQRWNLSNVDLSAITIDPLTGDEKKVNKGLAFGDNLLRHIVPGMELIFFKEYFTFRIGFDYHRFREMQVAGRSGAAGLSMGFGVNIYKFHLNYAFQLYNIAGIPNHIAISTNINNWKR